MVKLAIGLGVFYAVVALLIFVAHRAELRMVTPGLAAVRAAVWPVWLVTGRPKGAHLDAPCRPDDECG